MTMLMGPRNGWILRTRQALAGGVGTVLYGVLGWVTTQFKIPGPFNSQIRPAIAIPMFIGALFGPWAGFVTGFVGNTVIDAVSGYGFSWNWSLGNGLLGLICGLAFVRARELPSLRVVLVWSLIGTLVAFLFSSVTDMWADGIAPNAVLAQYFQVEVPNILSGAVLLPIIYSAYVDITRRQRRAKPYRSA